MLIQLTILRDRGIYSYGWSFVSFGGGTVNLTANSLRIIFVNYTNPADRTYTYTVKAPNSIGPYQFRGNYSMGSNVLRTVAGITTVSVVSCSGDADCNNGLYCDGTERCVNNACQAGTSVNCADSVSCTTDSCNEATDSCSHVASDAACNDGAFCNGVEFCSLTLGCRPGTAPSLTDMLYVQSILAMNH